MKFHNEIRFIDLFAGIGGFRIAMESYGGRCVFSSELDKYAKITYFENYGEMPKGDITKIESNEIPEHDVLCAGFPCQAFSISGKQRGFEDSRGILFFDIARIVEYHRPKMLFLENVANLKRHADGETIQCMIDILNDLGYDIYYKILNASDYGVPQSRKRVYFVCFRKDLGVGRFEFPEPINKDIALEDILLPDKETHPYIINKNNIKMIREEPDTRMRMPFRIGTINKGGQGDRIYTPKGHAITLSAYGGGSGAKTGAYLINGRIRKLAPEECRRVQGFPDGFKIPVTDQQAWKQFGNSVAVPVLEAIVKKVVEMGILDGKRYVKEEVEGRKVMTVWENFEIRMLSYLRDTYASKHIQFELKGGCNSTKSDIEVYKNGKFLFYIEIKMPTAQSGQFVILDEGGYFAYSKKNKEEINEYSRFLINIINENYERYKDVGTKPIIIDVDKLFFAEWIIRHYKKKKVKYVVTEFEQKYVIFPVERYKAYFNITANLRRKKSGSSSLPKKWINEIQDIIRDKYGEVECEIFYKIKHSYLKTNANIIDKLQLEGKENWYQFNSYEKGIYEIRKLSKTNNPNVIFLVEAKSKQNIEDLKKFKDEIDKKEDE